MLGENEDSYVQSCIQTEHRDCLQDIVDVTAAGAWRENEVIHLTAEGRNYSNAGLSFNPPSEM